MALGRWKPQPLVITPEQTLAQRKAGRFICTATWGSMADAEKGRNRPYRMSEAHPLHDGTASRLGWWGDKVTGHVGVLRVTLRLGRATIQVAGIAAVCADPRARNQGIASTLLLDALMAATKAGLSLSLLFGIPGFYHRFGFVPVFPSHTAIFLLSSRKNLPAIKRWRRRKAGPADLPMMLDLYNRVYGSMDCTAVRNPHCFLRRKSDIKIILQGPRKSDHAYAVLRITKKDGVEELLLLEAAGQGDDWLTAVIHEAMRQTDNRKLDRLTLGLPSEHPLSKEMIFCNSIDKTEHAANAAAMAAVLDFPALARQMAPEWSACIADAGVKVPKEGIRVRVGNEVYRWWPDRADGLTEPMPASSKRVDAQFGDTLARLVFGYGTADSIINHYGMRVSPAVRPILHAIFPERQCGFSRLDHF